MGLNRGKQPVDLHIEELVLHGFRPSDGPRIGDAIERALAHLIAEGAGPGWPHHAVSVETIDAGEFPLEVGSGPQAVGTRVAEAVYRGLPQDRSTSLRSTARQSAKGVRKL
jgi:hypothetical protein